MTRMFYLTIILATFATTTIAQTIPSELWGTWVVQRELPTSTISCWGETEARAIIGTEIEYGADSFRWKDKTATHPTAEVSVVFAEQFHDDNSGKGANSSQITFGQLGIKAGRAEQVTINHPGATSGLPSEPSEIPGDDVLLKNYNTIIFSICNLYFEAKRVVTPLVLTARIEGSRLVYRLNGKQVEDSKANSLLTNLGEIVKVRGTQVPVIIVLDVRASFLEMWDLETFLDKADLQQRRLFVSDFGEDGMMEEISWGRTGIPLPSN